MKKIADTLGLAQEINEDPRTITHWRRTGKIPFFRIGHRTIRFDVEKVKAALAKFEIKSVA